MTYRKIRSYEIGHVYGAATHDFLPVLPHYYGGYSDTPQTEEDEIMSRIHFSVDETDYSKILKQIVRIERYFI